MTAAPQRPGSDPHPEIPQSNRPRAGMAPPSGGCSSPGCCGPIDRRRFLELAAGASAAASLAGPFEPKDTVDHFVPADKKLKPEWVEALFARGTREFYAGGDLRMIAMPVGGITTGQVYLAGDGRLLHWDIFNETPFTGYGAENYAAGPPTSPLAQGFLVRVRSGDKTLDRTLDKRGFPSVRFCGEYPIGLVEYVDKEFPIDIRLEAFSPFIPLQAADSALPATVMEFTLRNTSTQEADVLLAGWLENGVCGRSGEVLHGVRENRAMDRDGFTMVLGSAKPLPRPIAPRPPIVLADFEGADYARWTAEGKAFGKSPAKGTLPGQQPVSGFVGKGLVNTFLGGDPPQGKLTSPPFAIDRDFLCLLVGGGNQKEKTCVNLLVDGKLVRTATGKNEERLGWVNWNLREFAGKEARIEIVDRESGPWGHINVDQIVLRDVPEPPPSGTLPQQPDFGTMGLAILSGGTTPQPGAAVCNLSIPAAGPVDPSQLAVQFAASQPNVATAPFGRPLVGGVGRQVHLRPGEETKITFVVAWHFPNRPQRGNYYATRFADAAGVVDYLGKHYQRLAGQTRLWHRTWYDSSLPYWLLDRLFSTVSILATGTCQWWANGRFWAWEGVGCCHGTCSHVWNYEHAMARLFPELERSVREMQDFNPQAGFVEDTGAVMFRGEDWKMWAGDSQPGTVLKAYREHLMSADDRFLKRNWPRIRKAMEFMIRQDADNDGLVEGEQHNTYDINFYGPNTMVGSLYLGALRAAGEMAREAGDPQFAEICAAIFDKGRKLSVEKLFNGEYFVQQVDLKKHPKHQYADGCLADQLFGQGWAHQVGLGYVYPEDKVRSALQAIWKYCWAPDVGPQNKVHPPQRWFARPGEAGLFTCTWPKSKHLGPESVLYRDEIWTGIEYQVAGNMVWDGMLTEALAICRGVHERYHPARHNPWNEIECGDHYSRAMASHGVFLALCGFEYHGPRGHLGFNPRLAPEAFQAAFTAAEGWGTISQERSGDGGKKSEDAGKGGKGLQTNRVEVRWGRLRLASLALATPAGTIARAATVTGPAGPVDAKLESSVGKVSLTVDPPLVLGEGQRLEVKLAYECRTRPPRHGLDS